MHSSELSCSTAAVLLGVTAVVLPAVSWGATMGAGANVQLQTPSVPPYVFVGPVMGSFDSQQGGILQAEVQGGFAFVQAYPQQQVGQIGGLSPGVLFIDWLLYHNESQADAYIQLIGEFTVQSNGTSQVPEFGLFSVNWGGALLPNTLFEAAYQAAFGQPTVTARAAANLAFGTPGNLNQTSTQNVVGNQDTSDENPKFGRKFEELMELDGPQKTFAFSLTIGGVGSRGGGFHLSGSVPSASSATQSAVTLGESFLDTSFFEIVLRLPPGATVSSDVPYLRAVPIPEPGALELLAFGLMLCAARCRQRL